MMRQIKEGRIRDIMTSPAYTLRPETPISGLKTLFAIHETTGFAVVDEERRLRGVVTVFDLLRAFRSQRGRWAPDIKALWGESVEDIMSPGAWTLDADEPIASAVDMMLNRNVGVIPVVEGRGDGRLVGIVEVRHVLSSLIFESPVSQIETRTLNGTRNMAGGRKVGMLRRIVGTTMRTPESPRLVEPDRGKLAHSAGR